MALKIYKWRGNTWQFEEGDQPVDAVPVEPAPKGAAAPADKAAPKPADKARRTRAKKAE